MKKAFFDTNLAIAHVFYINSHHIKSKEVFKFLITLCLSKSVILSPDLFYEIILFNRP